MVYLAWLSEKQLAGIAATLFNSEASPTLDLASHLFFQKCDIVLDYSQYTIQYTILPKSNKMLHWNGT